MKHTHLIFTSLFFLFLVGCKIVRLTENQSLIIKGNRLPFSIEKQQLLVNSTVHKTPTKLMFDTGSGGTVIYDSTIYPKVDKKNTIHFGKARTVNGDKIKKTYIPCNIENELFNYTNYLITPYSPHNLNTCADGNSKTFSGILGMDFLNELIEHKKDAILKLDFDNQEIDLINRDEFNNSLNQFELIESKFINKSQFKILLTINGISDNYLFDTGNSTGGILTKDKVMANSLPVIELEGYIAQGVSGPFYSTNNSIYNVTPIQLNTLTDSARIIVDDKIEQPNVGIDFIQKFNWIIDYNNRKVYVSERKLKEEYSLKIKAFQDYYVAVKNRDLRIIAKNKKANRFSVNQQITEVNGTKITSENMCDFAKEMNSQDFNWEKANIKTKN